MWPRQYASAYLRAGDDREKQRLALVGCPEDWQELVRYLIKYMRQLKQIKNS